MSAGYMPQMSVFANAEEMARDIPEDKRVDCTGLDMRIGLLQRGMQSGNPSVSMFFQLPDGRYGFFQTSLALFLQAAGIFGAIQEPKFVDIKPEPLEALRPRYPAAIATPYDLRKIDDLLVAGRPGTKQHHVFDFEEGIRLIVSREIMPDGRDSIHVSGSIHQGSEAGARMEAQCRATGTPAPAFDQVIWKAFCELSGVHPETKPIMFARSPGKGVPHFIIPYEAPRA